MGNMLSNAEIDVEEPVSLGLAVALSQQPESVDPPPEAMAAAVAKATGVYLMVRSATWDRCVFVSLL